MFVDALERGGFSGPLSYYRNLENDWQDLAPMHGRPLEVPAMFLGAEYDVGTWWGAEAIERAPQVIPNWLGSRVLQGAGTLAAAGAPRARRMRWSWSFCGRCAAALDADHSISRCRNAIETACARSAAPSFS